MVPAVRIYENVNGWFVVALVGVTFALWGLSLLLKRRADRRQSRRFDPDRGGSGMTQAGAWRVPVPDVAPTLDEESARDAVLLGYAAPFVAAAELNQGAWDLGRAAAADVVGNVIAQAGVSNRSTWNDRIRRVRAASAVTPEERAYVLAETAWLHRLGVAAGHESVESARAEVRSAESRARLGITGWGQYANLLRSVEQARPGLVSLRGLTAPGGAWAHAWPRP